eukprot:GHVL01009166.1.p1 GENE.GHVL01009166.1~~GHVL01009166.1.p1  ORF type:complete len:274 (-),score=52.03 GHVL01009166.1:379-1200(-)
MEVAAEKKQEMNEFEDIAIKIKKRFSEGIQLIEQVELFYETLLMSLDSRVKDNVTKYHHDLYLQREWAELFHNMIEDRAMKLAGQYKEAAKTLRRAAQKATDQTEALTLTGFPVDICESTHKIHLQKNKENSVSLLKKRKIIMARAAELQEDKNKTIEAISTVEATSAPTKEEEDMIREKIRELMLPSSIDTGTSPLLPMLSEGMILNRYDSFLSEGSVSKTDLSDASSFSLKNEYVFIKPDIDYTTVLNNTASFLSEWNRTGCFGALKRMNF